MLFDFLFYTAEFSERIARFYFKQLIDGLDHVHQSGLVHRDLKPENILFDSEFNLKIADFGFATPIKGRKGKGLCETRLGTINYMAPEVFAGNKYLGAPNDLFACAIILFIMITREFPFKNAHHDDPEYKTILAGRPEIFWKHHSKNKPNGEDFFSAELKDLVTSLLCFEPKKRADMNGVKDHPWFNNPDVPTLSEIQEEFKTRKDAVDIEKEKEGLKRKA